MRFLVQALVAVMLVSPCSAMAKSKVEVYNGNDGENVSLYGESAVISGVHNLPSQFSDPIRCWKKQDKPYDSGIDGQGFVYDAYLYDCGNNSHILIKKIVDGQYAGKGMFIIIPNLGTIIVGRK